jgi:hypothetical protein
VSEWAYGQRKEAGDSALPTTSEPRLCAGRDSQMTWALEHLPGFLLEILAGAVGAWLFAAWYPSISDYWARRSISSSRQKISRLQNAVAKYEVDFSDSRLFIGRILTTALSAIAFLIASVFCIALAFMYVILNELRCELQNDCVYSNMMQRIWYESGLHWSLTAIDSTVTLTMLGIGSAFWFFVTTRRLGLEISPDKYRARLSERIAELRARIPES